MERKNYKSDFSFFLDLFDGRGLPLGFPCFDFTIELYTTVRSNVYRVGCRGGEAFNCREKDGRLLVVMDGHNLYPGKLRAEVVSLPADSLYPDGTRKEVFPGPIDIELVMGASDFPDAAEVEMTLPLIKGDKGDPFTYADFTSGQIEELKRPAYDAAEDAERRMATAVGEMAAAVTALGEYREELEEIESERSLAENDRKTAESERELADKDRALAEADRAEAEERRGEEWDALKRDVANVETELWKSEIERRGSESVRVSAEESRVLSESARVSAESARAEAEAARTAAEREREEKSRYSFMTISFGEESTIAEDFNLDGDCEITYLIKENVRSCFVATGAEVTEAAEGVVLKGGAKTVWTIERVTDGLTAAIGIKTRQI